MSSERLSEIESDSKESVLKTVLMQLEDPTGQGEETAVEFAILESRLPLCTQVPRIGFLGSSFLSCYEGRLCSPSSPWKLCTRLSLVTDWCGCQGRRTSENSVNAKFGNMASPLSYTRGGDNS